MKVDLENSSLYCNCISSNLKNKYNMQGTPGVNVSMYQTPRRLLFQIRNSIASHLCKLSFVISKLGLISGQVTKLPISAIYRGTQRRCTLCMEIILYARISTKDTAEKFTCILTTGRVIQSQFFETRYLFMTGLYLLVLVRLRYILKVKPEKITSIDFSTIQNIWKQ